jgi:hypothetical protein
VSAGERAVLDRDLVEDVELASLELRVRERVEQAGVEVEACLFFQAPG